MILRTALLASLLFMTGSAKAAWYPIFQPGYLQLKPGQTVTVSAHAAWLSGISYHPFTTMTFAAEDPSVATVTGTLVTSAATPLQVTALQPGVTRVRVLEHGDGSVMPTSMFIVVAEETLPVAIAIDGVIAPDETVTLRVISNEPEATFRWYAGGLNGLYAFEAGSGRELQLTLSAGIIYEYWVIITTPLGAGAGGITIQAVRPPGRTRATRS